MMKMSVNHMRIEQRKITIAENRIKRKANPVQKMYQEPAQQMKKQIDESVDLLGFLFEIEAYEKNNHRHILDIPRIIFFV